jgi:thioredoxin reductase
MQRERDRPAYDVAVIGGGPAGLSAALVLGRARRRALVLDQGWPRNHQAAHVHGFLTRDGTPPGELRQLAREELRAYETVAVRDARVLRVEGARGQFRVHLDDGAVDARRILLCNGLVDDLPPWPGIELLWGHSVVHCPYCHGWEHRDRAFAFVASTPDSVDFALLLRSWTRDVVMLTDERFRLEEVDHGRLARASIRCEDGRVLRVYGEGDRLQHVELIGGPRVPCDVLFLRPEQRPSPLVAALGLALVGPCRVRVDAETGET